MPKNFLEVAMLFKHFPFVLIILDHCGTQQPLYGSVIGCLYVYVISYI